MSDNGRHEPVIELIIQASETDTERDVRPVSDAAYEALLEMDRLEEVLEAMGDLGAMTRLDAESLPVSPTTVEVIAELNALKMRSVEQIEARLAELAAALDDE